MKVVWRRGWSLIRLRPVRYVGIGLVFSVFMAFGLVALHASEAETPDAVPQTELNPSQGTATATHPTSAKKQASTTTKASASSKDGALNTGTVAQPQGSAVQAQPSLPAPSSYDVTVDFGAAVSYLGDYALGGTMSGYGTAWTSGAGACTNAPCAVMKRLGLGAYRVSIQWNNGNPVSGAGGNGAGGPSGDQMVDAIRAAGAEPVIVIGGKGGSNDMDFTDSDAGNLVAHYTSGKYAGAAAVKSYVVGNEPSNSNNGSMTVASYCTKFNSSAAAMRQANSGIRIIGPAWPYYDLNVIKQFLQCAGSNVDVVDYHAYGQSSQGIDANIQGSSLVYEQQQRDVRAAINAIVPGRAGQIAQQVGEYNVSPFASSDTSDERFYTGGTTVWNALATGSILKGGGRAFMFSDQNNPIGMIFQRASIAGIYGRAQSDPQPAYHGMGMFTGEGLFRHFGSTMVQASSTNADIVVYASDNQKNIVLINKSRDSVRNAAVQLKGVGSASASVWRTDKNKPFDNPSQLGTFSVDGGFSLDLPPYSVTTVVLD